QPNAELRYLLGTEQGSTIERLHAYLAETSPQERRFAPLSEFLVLRRGEELGYKSSLLIRTSPCDGQDGQWNERMGYRVGAGGVESGGEGPCGRPLVEAGPILHEEATADGHKVYEGRFFQAGKQPSPHPDGRPQ